MKDLVSPRELLRRFRVATFDFGKEMRSKADEVGAVSCRSGCSNCCKQKVVSTPAEGMAIFLYLFTNGRWSEALEARLAEEDAYATKTNHADWFRERRPCPFLDGDACGVYPVRPLGCASTFSTGDPAFCGRGDIVNRVGYGQMQISSPSSRSTAALVLLHMAVEANIPGSGYMTLPGAVLAAALFATKRPPRRSLTLPITGDADGLIEKFDAEGAVFDAGGGR